MSESKKPLNHLAIIMDGNGRWAKKRHLPRFVGHRHGMDNIRNIALAANKLGIKVLTLYAFSTENWARPTDEVNYLMRLPIDFFDKFMPEYIFVHHKRMSFIEGGGTDSVAYAHYVWRKGYYPEFAKFKVI